MRATSLLLFVFCMSGCLSSAGPMLVSVNAWERGELIDAAETRRLERLELPRNAELTFRAVDVTAGAARDLTLHCRVHTADGGTITWQLAPEGQPTDPIRAKWLKGLEVLVGTPGQGAPGQIRGASVLAEVPPTGSLGEAQWERLQRAVADLGGVLVMAARIPVYPGENEEPGRMRRYFVFEGEALGGDGQPAQVVSAVIELGIEIVDRDHRPKQKDEHSPERYDPVRQPPPRDFAVLR